MTPIVLFLDFFILLNFNDQLHTSACKVKDQVTQIHVDNSGKIIPIECLRVIHEEKRDENSD